MTAAGTKFVFAHFNGRIRCEYHPVMHVITPINDSVEINIKTPIWNSTDSLDNVYHLTSEKKELEIRLPVTLCIKGANRNNKTVLVTATKPIFIFVSDIQKLVGEYFIIYPVQTLGTEYVASGYTSDDNASRWAIIGCIALYDDTEVTVVVPANQSFTYNNTSYPGGSQIHVSLKMYQNVRINGFDVTGSFIKSNNPISVFSGHEFIWVPGPTRSNGLPVNGKDKMTAQLPPISTMSTIYPIVSTQINDEEWVRVIALHDNTSFSIYNENPSVLQLIEVKGSFYEFSIPRSSAATIVSEKPINVVQYSASGNNIGDPRMMITLSLDNYISEYIFVVPNNDNPQHFTQLLVIIATNSSLDRIFIDGTKLTESDNRSGQTSCHYANLLAVWLAVGDGKYHVQCNLTENEYCTVYIHGYSNNNQYGTEANRYIGSLDTVKVISLPIYIIDSDWGWGKFIFYVAKLSLMVHSDVVLFNTISHCL